MSIRDLKRDQEEGLLRLKVYNQALRKLDEKLVLFNNEAARAIFETVESRTLLVLEKNISAPMSCVDIAITEPKYTLRHVSASFRVSGTDVEGQITNYPYTKALKQELLFGEYGVNGDAKFKTALDAWILPFDLRIRPPQPIDYSFTWKGMEDNQKVVNAIMQWFDKNTFPPSDLA